MRKRDFPDDDEVSDIEATSNDRYQDITDDVETDDSESVSTQATAAAEAARRTVRSAVESAEEEVDGVYKKMKRWLVRPARHV